MGKFGINENLTGGGEIKFSGGVRMTSPSGAGAVLEIQDNAGNAGAAHIEASGIILRSPDGTRYLVLMQDGGGLASGQAL